MIQTILNTIITFIVGGFLGYCSGKIKKYQTNVHSRIDELQQLKETQLMDMRSDLSNKFYVYDTWEEVEDYLVMSFREKCEKYFEMGGNNWVHPMYDKSFQWKIKPTGYLK